MKSELIFALLLGISLCIDGVYIHTNVTDFKCFRDKSYSVAFIRGFLSTGIIDPYLISNLKGASYLGSPPIVYMNPCLKCKMSLTDQFKKLLNALNDFRPDAFVFKVKLSDNWPSNPSLNCNNLKLVVTEVLKIDLPFVIQSDINDWNRIMGKDCSMKSYKVNLVWDKHDKQKNFKNFKPFGGFDEAVVKEYDGPLQICGHSVDVAFDSGIQLFDKS